MKKLKNLFSFMLVAVFALSGTLMLTGCKKEEQPIAEPPIAEPPITELTKAQKIEIVEDVLNDTISKLEIAQMFDVGDTVHPKSEVTNSVFSEFGDVVVNGATDLETFSSDYLTYCFSDSEVEMTIEVSSVILEIVKMGNFDFNSKVTYFVDEGNGQTEEINVKLNFNENNFVFGIYGEDEFFSFYKFNYSNNSIVSVEQYEDGGDYESYVKFTISTDISKRALDNIIDVGKETYNYEGVGEITGYYCTIYSEEEGKCFTAPRDMIRENELSLIQFVYGAETYGEMVEACKDIIDNIENLLESLN